MANNSRNIFINQDALVGAVFALLAAVGFSAKAILVKLAYLDRVDAVTLLALRMAFSVPFFIGVALWAKRQHAEPLSGHDQILVLILGLIGYYLSSFLDFLGLQYISAGLERLILFLYPTMTVILSALLYKRAIGRKVIAAMALCYAGIVLVFFHDLGMMQGSIVLGLAGVCEYLVLFDISGGCGACHCAHRCSAIHRLRHDRGVCGQLVAVWFNAPNQFA